MHKNFEHFQKIVDVSCSKETCYPGDSEKWSVDVPETGHCAIVAMLAQDTYGGEIHKARYKDGENRGTHYFNIIDGHPVDFTQAQFSSEVVFNCEKIVERKNLQKTSDVRKRYEILRARVAKSEE